MKFAVLCIALALPAAFAQEGHPLTGTWHGEWQPASGSKTPVVMFLKWDNKNVVGTINPGPRAIQLKEVTLDPIQWTVHFEAEGKDASGKAVPIQIDGKLDNLGSYNRTFTGTWTQSGAKAPFKMARD